MAIKVSGAKPKRKKKRKSGLLKKIGQKLFGGGKGRKKRGRDRGKASKGKAGASSD